MGPWRAPSTIRGTPRSQRRDAPSTRSEARARLALPHADHTLRAAVRTQDYYYLAFLLAAELKEIDMTEVIDFEPKPGQELGPHGSNGYIGRWTDLSGLKLKRMRMARCKFFRIKTGRETGAGSDHLDARRNHQFLRCDLRGRRSCRAT